LCREPEAVFAPYLLRLLLSRLIETPLPPDEKRIAELETFVRNRPARQSNANRPQHRRLERSDGALVDLAETPPKHPA
jgi:hypothetical protein